MRILKTTVSTLALCMLATAAYANGPAIEEPHFAPGPEHVSAVPHYYDPHHSEHDYRYWQSIHDEQVQAQQQREHELAIRRAEADRALAVERMEQAQQNAPVYAPAPPVYYAPASR